MSQDSFYNICPGDVNYIILVKKTPNLVKLSPQTFSEDDLNDLIRDMSLSKEKIEFLTSRLKQKFWFGECDLCVKMNYM